jgi:hypothetical protein
MAQFSNGIWKKEFENRNTNGSINKYVSANFNFSILTVYRHYPFDLE